MIVLLVIIRQNRDKQPGTRLLYQLMMLSMTFIILSELSFTLYTDVYGIMNFLGHIYKYPHVKRISSAAWVVMSL